MAGVSPAPSPRTARGRTGIAAEAIARRYLEALGWRVVDSNVVVGRGELDLVALDPDEPGVLVVVEVRGARTRRFGPPEISVDARKLGRVLRAAWELARSGWIDERGLAVDRLRVDVLAVELAPSIGRDHGGPTIRHLRGVG